MAVTEDKKFSELTLVGTPKPSDEFGCNQGGDSFKQTRLQLHTLQTGESYDTAPTAPQIFKAGGVEGLRLTNVSGSILQTPEANVGLTADVGSSQGDGVITSSYNVYSVVANAGDAATLPAVFAIDTVIYIKNDGANSMDIFPASGDNAGAGTDVAIAIDSGVSAVFIATAANAVWTQLLSFGGGGDVTKVGTPVNNQIGVWTGDGTLEGTTALTFDSNDFIVGGSGAIIANNSQGIRVQSPGGATLPNVTATSTIPSVVINQGDLNTGLGTSAFDAISFICGGVEGLRLAELNSGVIQAPDGTLGITAFATGGQVSAIQLNTSYNVLGTVATIGDSVKLPPTFTTNSLVYIKNDGASAADIFPALGDDLGAGTDTALSVPSGESKVFIATVANATWTELLPSAAGGGGGVTKVGTPVNNQLGVWTGDGTIEGEAGLIFDAGVLTVTGTIQAADAAGPAMLNEAASATNPTLLPNKANPTTGIGQASATVISVISGGAEDWRLGGTIIQGIGAGGGLGSGPLLFNQVPTSTTGTLFPNRTDLDTGIGWAAADQLSFIAGGVEAARALGVGGQLAVAVGTLSAPGLSFIGDLNTGMHRVTTDQLALVAGALSCISIKNSASARQIGFYVTAPISLQTGVAVSSAGIHAALVNLGLITA